MLITGATGFVGSHVAEAFLAAGRPVRLLVRDPARAESLRRAGAELVVGSLDDGAALREAVEGVRVVAHLAAATRAGSPAEFERVNAEGTRAVLEAVLAEAEGTGKVGTVGQAVAGPVRSAARRPARLVYLSSLSAVGPARSGRPVERGDTPRPLTAYGRSKLRGEEIVLGAADRLGVVVLRAPAVYGPRDRDLFTFFRLASLGVLPVPTGPDRRIQMVHVRDLAESVVAAANAADAKGVYHVAEARSYAWREVLDLVAEAVGRRGRVVPLPAGLLRAAGAVSEGWSRLWRRPGVFDRDKARELLAEGWLCETEGAREELGFEARTPLDRGLRETAAWYRREGWL